jgi:YHS domain-containing protein
MERFISLLLFALFFYLMMRFGCGAHMVHGHGARYEHEPDGRLMESRDPVCGMNVDDSAGYTRMLKGRAYRFCSRQCLDTFEADPDKYAG